MTVDAQSPSAPTGTSSLEGFVDALDAHTISGWAWDRSRPEVAIEVDLYVDGVPVQTARADQLGGDLAAAGIGDGRHRWRLDAAGLVADDGMHELKVCYGGTSTELSNSPKRYLKGLLDLLPDVELQALLAARHIRGEGLEVGALNRPLSVPSSARTRYVDRMTKEELEAEYPEMRGYEFVPVHVVDDGETLATLDADSTDYVIANNFLEHCEDPIGTLKSFYRVVRPGGVLFLVIPNRRGNIDVHRAATPIEHLVEDHEHGPERSRRRHYEEWARHVLRVGDDDGAVATAVEQLERDEYSIHFHVFTEFEVLELALVLHRRYGLRFTVEQVADNAGVDTVLVLRKAL